MHIRHNGGFSPAPGCEGKAGHWWESYENNVNTCTQHDSDDTSYISLYMVLAHFLPQHVRREFPDFANAGDGNVFEQFIGRWGHSYATVREVSVDEKGVLTIVWHD